MSPTTSIFRILLIKSNGYLKARRCIFTNCRKDNTFAQKILINTATDDMSHRPAKSSQCKVCQQDGDLVLCIGCDRGYHPFCHCQKIKFLPQKGWLCMECNPRYRPVGYLLALLPDTGKVKKVKVIGPAVYCSVCSEKCADAPSVREQNFIQCRSCDAHFHLGCHEPPLESKPIGIK